MPPGLWGPQWWRQWCQPRVITIRKARAGGKQNYCSHLAGWERKESEVDSHGCSGEKINSSVFKDSSQLSFKGTHILVDRHAGHQSCIHACNAELFVFVSNKISYCSYVHHFIRMQFQGLCWNSHTKHHGSLPWSMLNQSSVWKFPLPSSEQHLVPHFWQFSRTTNWIISLFPLSL